MTGEAECAYRGSEWALRRGQLKPGLPLQRDTRAHSTGRLINAMLLITTPESSCNNLKHIEHQKTSCAVLIGLLCCLDKVQRPPLADTGTDRRKSRRLPERPAVLSVPRVQSGTGTGTGLGTHRHRHKRIQNAPRVRRRAPRAPVLWRGRSPELSRSSQLQHTKAREGARGCLGTVTYYQEKSDDTASVSEGVHDVPTECPLLSLRHLCIMLY